MNKFTFVFLTSTLSVIFAGIICAILGYIQSYFIPEHAHQIVPTWMLAMVLGCSIAFLTSIIYLAFNSNITSFLISTRIPIGTSVAIITMLLLYISTR